jgi:phage baseplate assembly protein V
MEFLGQLMAPPDGGPAPFSGVTVGIVTNNRDPDGLGRVKVKLPSISEQVESDWARVSSPMAGRARGLYWLPEVDDEVLVAFEHGRPDSVYVLGGLWNGKDKPPESNADGKNDLRTIKTRSGHVIRLTDTQGDEKIEIIDKSAKNSIVISTKNNTVTITGNADVTVQSSTGKLRLAGQQVEISSQGALTIEAKQNATVQAQAQLNLKGQLVNIN